MVNRKSFFILIIFLGLVFCSSKGNTVESALSRPQFPNEIQGESQGVMFLVKKERFSEFEKHVKKMPELSVGHTYRNVFHGFSIKGSQKELKDLENHPAVIYSGPVVTYQPHIEDSVSFIGANDVKGIFDRHNQRLTGKGVKVAVIDTGIDYNHPDLSGNYAGGYDLIDGDKDPMESRSSDGGITVHGTHVAGIIAANGKIRGVAPDAEIIAYRALGPSGVGTSDQVIAAIDKAVEDKVDIINLSLGNSVNGPDWPTSLALDHAVEAGVIAVTSSGNSGPKLWTVGSPGTSAKAITVGASSPPLQKPFLQLSTNKEEVPMNTFQGAKPWVFKGLETVVYRGVGKNLDESVRNKIVLLKRGEISFTEKALIAESQGAKAVIIYNNVDGEFSGALEVPVNIPVVSISKEAGLALKQHLRKHPSVRMIFKREVDKLANFSSRGPVTHTWAIKPDVVAPGIAIASTIPNGYLALQGTSMAAPHVTGACALIKQAHPEWSPEQVKASIMNTAKPLINNNQEKFTASEQGNGRIRIKEAIKSKLLVYPGSITFGQYETNHPRTKKHVKLTLDNQSNEQLNVNFNMPKNQQGIQWQLPQKVVIEPKGKRTVTISLDLTPNLISSGIHQGWLQVNSSGDTIDVPYIYVVDEPNYPRIMGFHFVNGDKPNTYKYQIYLPGGADEAGIVVYDSDTMAFAGFIDWKRNVSRGVMEKEISRNELNMKPGLYKAVAYAKKGSKEDQIETEIYIEE